jgi:hypothetical protein
VSLQQANLRVRGAVADDRLGWSIAGLGDMNGDRKADVAVGAPFAGNNDRTMSGSAYVLYGRFAAGDVDLSASRITGFRVDGAAEGDFAAGSIAAAGDVNGDRRADLLIGAPETDNNDRGQSGSVYVVFGGAHRGRLDLASPGWAGSRVDGAEAGDQVGSSVARMGDLNKDGRADIVVGAPLADNNELRDSGSVYVVLGRSSTDGVDLAFPESAHLRIDGGEVEARAGWSVAGAGDVNGDGRPDVVIGAPYANPNGRFLAGSAYVVFGQAAAGVVDLATPGRWGFRIDGPAAGDVVFGGAGWSVAGVGDVNGDRRADVVVGFPFFDARGREDSGSAFVVFGKAGFEPVDLAALGNRGFRVDGAAAGDLAGAAVADLGDVNADGLSDLLVGAEQADNNRQKDSGSVYVVYGRRQSGVVDLRALGKRGARIDGELTDDLAGWSVARAGDVNGDRRPDVLVGAHASDYKGRPEAGTAYVLFAPDLEPPRLVLAARPRQPVLRQKGVVVRASCSEACSLRATGTISRLEPRVSLPLLPAEGRLSNPGRRTLELGLSPEGVSRLSDLFTGKGRIEVTLKLRALDAGGNVSVARARVLVRA